MNSTKKITEGAMMVAIVGTLLVLNRQTANFIDFALFWIVPLPVVLYTAKYGFKNALMLVVSIIVIAIITGVPSALFYTCMGSAVGLLLGDSVRKQKEQSTLLLISCVVSIVSTFLGMFVFASILGYNLMDEVSATTQMIESAMQAVGMEVKFQSMTSFIPILVMLSVLLSALLEGVLVYLLSYMVLHRMKIKTTPMKPLSQIQLPKKWGYLLFIFYIGSVILLNVRELSAYSNLWYFIQTICLLVLLGNGYLCAMTIMAYYKKKNLAWLLVIAVLPPFNILLAILGYLDSVKNVRWEETIYKQERR